MIARTWRATVRICVCGAVAWRQGHAQPRIRAGFAQFTVDSGCSALTRLDGKQSPDGACCQLCPDVLPKKSLAYLIDNIPYAEACTEIGAVQERTRRLVHVFRLMVRADPSVPEIYPWPEQNRKTPVHLWHPHFSVAADPRNPKLLYDAKLMPRLLRPPLHLPHPLAVVTKIRVSRKGEFSCPVRTGAVLAGLHLKSIRNTRGSGTLSSEMEPFGSVRSSSLPWPNAAPDAMPTGSVVVPGSACLSESAHESSLAGRSSTCHSSLAEDTVVDVGHVRNALVDLTPAAARRLHHCTSFVTLEDMVARDLLPAILQVHVHRVRSHFCGVTVEFEPSGEGCAEVCSIGWMCTAVP